MYCYRNGCNYQYNKNRGQEIPLCGYSWIKKVISRLVHPNPAVRLNSEIRKKSLFRHQLRAISLMFKKTFIVIISFCYYRGG